MSEADLKRQTWLVRVAMTDLSSGSDARAGAHSKCMRDPSPDKLIATAARIGDSICDLAIMDGERATWLIPSIVDDRRLVATVAGFDLYEGLSGIALFLAHLGIVTEDRRYVRVAVAAMEEAIALYKAADREALSLGAYNGVGGLARVLALLASPLDRPRWTNDAAAILHEAVRLAMESFEIDIISGQAGLLAAALATRRTSDTALLHGLLPLAAKLKRLTTRAPRHTKAKLPIKGDAGVAHGRAGIGFALLRWTAMVYGSSCDEIAERLIRFDMKAINRTAGTPSAQAQAHGLNGNPLGWCRGLLGIALMALQAGTVRIGADARWLNKIADGIIANGTEGPLCLCHGALGQLEFLAVMADQGLLRDPQGAAAWRRQLLARIVGGDWVADSGHRLESPGLMVGLAGTGYSLLRAARSQSLPSVLTIEV